MMNAGDPDILSPHDQGEPSGSGRSGPGEQEGLRLIQAFRSISNPKVRRTIIELVEHVSRRMARRSRDP
jgi:hypothetical protein